MTAKECLRCARPLTTAEAAEYMSDDEATAWMVCSDCRTDEEVERVREATKARYLAASRSVRDLNAAIDAAGPSQRRDALKQRLREAETEEDRLARILERSVGRP